MRKKRNSDNLDGIAETEKRAKKIPHLFFFLRWEGLLIEVGEY
jgi:hypothetical protein